MVRALDHVDPAPVAGITAARAPFFSADGRWVAYFDQGGELRKVSVTGGRPITICKVTGTSRGGSWGADDVIVFATSGSRGLMRVGAAGGEPTRLSSLGPGEGGHFYPAVLPGYQEVLFVVASQEGGPSHVAILNPGGQHRTLIRDANRPGYVANVELNLAASRTGTIAYVRAPAPPKRSLVWIDRHGKEAPIDAPEQTYQQPRLSQDGGRVAVVFVFDDGKKNWDV